jgi:hypothetical protein
LGIWGVDSRKKRDIFQKIALNLQKYQPPKPLLPPDH